jgi:glycosyltransferase involved in cell wall biosynthesis
MNTRKAGTYIEGIRTIDADILLFVDADDSFVIDDIALMINILREGYYDMVVGSKDLTAENRPPLRRLLSFAKRLLTKSMLPKGVYDSQTGLKAMKSTTAKYIIPYLHMNTGLAIDLEILHLARKLDFRVLQIPVTCIDREGSHVDVVKDSIAFLKNIFRIRKNNKKVRIDSTEVKGK